MTRLHIFLLRHGEAASSAVADSERPLTVRGRRSIRQAALAVSRMGLSFDRVLSSPYARAMETAALFHDGTNSRCGIEATARLLPGTGLERAYEAIAPATPDTCRPPAVVGPPRILVVGHMPLLGEIMADLIGAPSGGQLSLGKGTLVWMEVNGFPARGRGSVVDVFTLNRLLAL